MKLQTLMIVCFMATMLYGKIVVSEESKEMETNQNLVQIIKVMLEDPAYLALDNQQKLHILITIQNVLREYSKKRYERT